MSYEIRGGVVVLRRALAPLSLGLFAALTGCPAPQVGPTTDAAMDASLPRCVRDTDCDDGSFCNGIERCGPGETCTAGVEPCEAGQACDEAADRCSSCPGSADADGDGARSLACGGTDCDDADPDRYPGHPEVCDVAGVDEDCDPSTFGFRDADADGFADAACCNHEGSDVCGTDCHDSAPGVHPTAPEVCNLGDDDCDSAVDEGVTTSCWLDADHDGFAPAGASPMTLCACGAGTTSTAPSSANATDCDDTAVDVSPGVPEICGNGRDDNCDGVPDVGSQWYADCDADGFGDPSSTPTTSCSAPGTRPSCAEATPSWSTDARDCNDHLASTRPHAPELCNGVDDDCDAGTADGSSDAACMPGAGTCVGGTCCRGCVTAAGTCSAGTTTSSCGRVGGACSACADCVACTVGVCSGPTRDTPRHAVCAGGAGLCTAGACCTGCTSGGTCVAGTSAGACGFGGNVCSTCGTCSSGVCAGTSTCASPIDVTTAPGAVTTIAVDTCAHASSYDSVACGGTLDPQPTPPPGTPDVVLSAMAPSDVTYMVEVGPGWTVTELDAACTALNCRSESWNRSANYPVHYYLGVERTAGGCGRVTISVRAL